MSVFRSNIKVTPKINWSYNGKQTRSNIIENSNP